MDEIQNIKGHAVDTNEIKIRKLDYSIVKKWILRSYEILKENYGLIFTFGFLDVFFRFVSSVLHLNDLPTLFLELVFLPGYIFVVKKLIEKKSIQFSDIFYIIYQKGQIFKLLPFALLLFFSRWIFSIFFPSGNSCSSTLWCSYTLAIAVSAAGFFMANIVLPLMVLNGFHLIKAFSQSLKATFKNFGYIFMFSLIMLVLRLLTRFLDEDIAYSLPMVLVIKPIEIVQSYIVYAALFEKLIVETEKVDHL